MVEIKLSHVESPEVYLQKRLSYYANNDVCSTLDAERRVYPETLPTFDKLARFNVINTLNRLAGEAVVVTSTKNRLDYLQNAHESIQSQVGCDWNWLIIDNGSTDGTVEAFNDISARDPRVQICSYIEMTGCAFPVRNIGMDLLQIARNQPGKNERGFFINLDSDDRLHDPYSLKELSKVLINKSYKGIEAAMGHGFAECYYYENGKLTFGTHPHNFYNDFPIVPSLTEVYDRGLNILSGGIPISSLPKYRYPQEASFEDNGLNHKILLQAKKDHDPIASTLYPITVKTFHSNTMTATNNAVGDQLDQVQIGEHTVHGLRSQIVNNLAFLREYFYKEGL